MLTQAYYIVDFLIDRQKQDLLNLLRKQAWSRNRTLQDIESMERTCFLFGLIERETSKLIGFTRVLTDDIKYAYIHDVIIDDTLQGKGLGRFIIESIINHPRFQHILCFDLHCMPDNIPFYNKLNFKEHTILHSLRFDRRSAESTPLDQQDHREK